MTQKVIGWVDTKWKPPRKSKLELQIEKEDAINWANREDLELAVYSPAPFHLTETAKAAFAGSIHLVKLLIP